MQKKKHNVIWPTENVLTRLPTKKPFDILSFFFIVWGPDVWSYTWLCAQNHWLSYSGSCLCAGIKFELFCARQEPFCCTSSIAQPLLLIN